MDLRYCICSGNARNSRQAAQSYLANSDCTYAATPTEHILLLIGRIWTWRHPWDKGIFVPLSWGKPPCPGGFIQNHTSYFTGKNTTRFTALIHLTPSHCSPTWPSSAHHPSPCLSPVLIYCAHLVAGCWCVVQTICFCCWIQATLYAVLPFVTAIKHGILPELKFWWCSRSLGLVSQTVGDQIN